MFGDLMKEIWAKHKIKILFICGLLLLFVSLLLSRLNNIEMHKTLYGAVALTVPLSLIMVSFFLYGKKIKSKKRWLSEVINFFIGLSLLGFTMVIIVMLTT